MVRLCMIDLACVSVGPVEGLYPERQDAFCGVGEDDSNCRALDVEIWPGGWGSGQLSPELMSSLAVDGLGFGDMMPTVVREV